MKKVNIINYYTRLIYLEAINVKEQEKICPIGKKIILKLFEKWILYYMKISIKILSKNFNNLNKNAFKEKILMFNENIKNEILNIVSDNCKNYVNLFFELYYTLLYEFLDIVISLFNSYDKLTIIDNLGELLHMLCINSIFLTVEIKNTCINENCIYINNEECNELKIFINDFYLINNYGIKKIEKIKKYIKNKNLNIILDCQYLTKKNNKKLYKIYKTFKKYFKNVEIKNLKGNLK